MSDRETVNRERVISAAREVREYARGGLGEVDHRDLSPAAGMVRDDDVRDLLTFAARAWQKHADSADRDFWDTEWADSRLSRQADETATHAVKNGNLTQLEFTTGWPQYESDVRGLHAIQQLENWLLYAEAVKVVYLAGHMGNGKTDFAHLMIETIEHRSEHDQSIPAAEIATNIPTSEYQSITAYPRFETWVESGEHGSNRWFVFDEASSTLSGYAHDRQAVEQLISHLVKLARKYGVNIIIIGHTGMDLHADLRRLCDYCEKTSLKTASVYKTVNKGEGAGHLFDLDRLPPTRSEFATDDEAPWSWGDALEDGDVTDDPALDQTTIKRIAANRAAGLYEQVDDVTQQQAVDLLSGDGVDISRAMLRKAQDGEYNEVSA